MQLVEIDHVAPSSKEHFKPILPLLALGLEEEG